MTCSEINSLLHPLLHGLATLLHPRDVSPSSCAVATPPSSPQTTDSSPETTLLLAPALSCDIAGPVFDSRRLHKNRMILPNASVSGPGWSARVRRKIARNARLSTVEAATEIAAPENQWSQLLQTERPDATKTQPSATDTAAISLSLFGGAMDRQVCPSVFQSVPSRQLA
jgi:hypothetical protein